MWREMRWLLVLGLAAGACGRTTVAPMPAAPIGQSEPMPQSESTSAPAPQAPVEVAHWPSELFLVRPAGPKGPALAYDMADGTTRFTLPAGLLSADGMRYFAAEADASTTRLVGFDPATGDQVTTSMLDGRWALSGISPTGRWLALARMFGEDEKRAWVSADEWRTEVQIVAADTGAPAHLLSLEGNFEVETVSADGKSLFLVQHLPAANPDHYLVRLYDLSQESLVADPLRAKGSDEVMAGLAWDGVGSPDGRWLLTLYLSTRRNVAFIHTLNLHDKFPLCIDLPSGQGDFDQLKHYALTLSPDGHTVYATNAALGVVAEVSLKQLKVTRVAKYDVGPALLRLPYGPVPVGGRSVLSADGRTLYFGGGSSVWAYDTRSGQVSGPHTVHEPVVGLGISGDGQRLYVVGPGQHVRVLEAATGAALSWGTARAAGQ